MDEVDAAERSNPEGAEKGGNAKKWQPLTSVAPNPEEENDPFALGDDDEADKTEDLRKDDSERLKEAARSSVSAGASGAAGEGLKPAESERSGSMSTRNKEAEELLGGKKEESKDEKKDEK